MGVCKEEGKTTDYLERGPGNKRVAPPNLTASRLLAQGQQRWLGAGICSPVQHLPKSCYEDLDERVGSQATMTDNV